MKSGMEQRAGAREQHQTQLTGLGFTFGRSPVNKAESRQLCPQAPGGMAGARAGERREKLSLAYLAAMPTDIFGDHTGRLLASVGRRPGMPLSTMQRPGCPTAECLQQTNRAQLEEPWFILEDGPSVYSSPLSAGWHCRGCT